MALQVGGTHDVVVLVNDSTELGLTVKPHSYRLGRAPEFIARMGGGPPSATDFDWWRALIQREFDLGEGPSEINDLDGLRTFRQGFGVIPWPSGAGPALQPTATSMVGLNPLELSSRFPIHIAEMSDAARAWYYNNMYTYTAGFWAANYTQGFGIATYNHAVAYHSNTFFVGISNVNLGYRAYGSQSASHAAAIGYVPAYSTVAWNMFTYDSKLWRTYQNKIAYYTDSDQWSAYMAVGDEDTIIRNVATAFGRIYIGKDDGLWCYEAGRIYEVEPFEADTSKDNFTLMHATHGALYFNIRNSLYRYTGAGNVELLYSHPYKAVLGPAATAQEKLFFSVRDESHCGSVRAYDLRSHGHFNELDLQTEAARYTSPVVAHVTGLGVAENKLWLAPFETTCSVPSTQTDPPFIEYPSVNYELQSGSLGFSLDNVTRWGMKVVCQVNGVLTGLRFLMRKSRTPGFTLEAAVYSDDGAGLPNVELVSKTITTSSIGATLGWKTITFTAPLAVTAGTTYHFILQATADTTETLPSFYVGLDYLYNAGWTECTYYKPGTGWAVTQHYKMLFKIVANLGGQLFGARISHLPSERLLLPPQTHRRQHSGTLKLFTPWLTLGYPGLSKFISDVRVEALLEGVGTKLGVSIAFEGGEQVQLLGVVQNYDVAGSNLYRDHTANLIDGDPDTYVAFEWGTWAADERLFGPVSQWLYIVAEKPFDTITWKLKPGTIHSRQFTTGGSFFMEAWSGTEWLPVKLVEDTTKVGNWGFARSGQMSFRPPRAWESLTFEEYTGYCVRIYSICAAPGREAGQRIYEMNTLAHSPEAHSFTPLGDVEGVGNLTQVLEVRRRAVRVALCFHLVSTPEAAVFLKSYKLSFNPVGEGKREVRFVVVADDNLKRLDGTIEHSGTYIAQAISSLHDSGLLYTVGLPYPAVHSINAQVQLGESILVPTLAYTAQTGKPTLVPYADIPLRIIEG